MSKTANEVYKIPSSISQGAGSWHSPKLFLIPILHWFRTIVSCLCTSTIFTLHFAKGGAFDTIPYQRRVLESYTLMNQICLLVLSTLSSYRKNPSIVAEHSLVWGREKMHVISKDIQVPLSKCNTADLHLHCHPWLQGTLRCSSYFCSPLLKEEDKYVWSAPERDLGMHLHQYTLDVGWMIHLSKVTELPAAIIG